MPKHAGEEMRISRLAATIVLVLIAACDGRLAGTYGDLDGLTIYEFYNNGQARISVLGNQIYAQYTVDGDQVFVTSPQGTVVLTRKGESLYGPMGLELTQQAE